MISKLVRFIEITKYERLVSATKAGVRFLLNKKKLFKPADNTEGSINIYYNQENNRLAELCDKYGTDKGGRTSDSNPYPWKTHNYTDFYHFIFDHRRDSVESLLECGIGTTNTNIPCHMGEQGVPGASLRVWRDYFANANVVGIDIDNEILFSEKRIETYCVDQTSKDSIEQFIDTTKINEFDVIIDDGLHQYDANVCLFENVAPLLSEEGVYIIEDISYDNLDKYINYFINGLDKYYARLVEIDNTRIAGKDRIIMITPK